MPIHTYLVKGSHRNWATSHKSLHFTLQSSHKSLHFTLQPCSAHKSLHFTLKSSRVRPYGFCYTYFPKKAKSEIPMRKSILTSVVRQAGFESILDLHKTQKNYREKAFVVISPVTRICAMSNDEQRVQVLIPVVQGLSQIQRQLIILTAAIKILRKRIAEGTANFLVKVKAHLGEPANEGANILADKAILGPKVGKEWCQRTNRVVFTWEKQCCEAGKVAYQDRHSTFNNSVRDTIRRGAAENEVPKHEEKLTGAWRQINTLTWCIRKTYVYLNTTLYVV